MPIKLPREIAYFYEITMMTDRLFYCIPEKQLHAMVKRGKVRENILKDYPDGVDIKVSPLQYKEFQESYGMNFNVDPRLIWMAFQSLKRKMQKKYFGTGFINSRFLEDLAKQIQPDYFQGIFMLPAVNLEPGAFKHQRRFQKEMRLSHKRLDKRLEGLSIKDIDPEKTIVEQRFGKINMSRGDEPFDFLSRYKQKPKKGK